MYELPIHSPVEEISDPLFIRKGVRVFIKRDDMIHPFISGNKWRKLKYNLTEAGKAGKNHLVTFGGAWSNHLLATACAAARFNFSSTGFVRGEQVSNDVLTLCNLFGMDLRFTERGIYRDKQALFERFSEDYPGTYFIDEGGAGKLGMQGCAELVDELSEDYDHVFCAAGTGTTAAGIIEGIRTRGSDTRVHVIPVLKGAEFLKAEICKFTSYPFEFHTSYHFGGYAKTSEELLSFIGGFCRSTGILIEPVYTGKVFFALYDLISKGTFPAGSSILAVHTGGLTGILGMADKFRR